MTRTVDLNADMGEGYGPWTMGDDAALLEIVTSANIACGFHAGDPDVMAQTMGRAIKNGVGIGAHPGFADLKGFGRRQLPLSHTEIANAVAYQLGAAQAIARRAGGTVKHLKLHGALSNMASVDADLARACYTAALAVDPDITIMVLAATAMETIVRDLGCAWAGEIFADRAYNDDATLVDRSKPGAVLHDAAIAAPRILDMLNAGAIIAESGKHIPCQIDTICLHGDTPAAVDMARDIRDHLQAAGVTLKTF
ncbi:LamB/YcsF family protein [Yoonia sp. I 8.24]|uniref:LamB/YcsF family protein n=1 Tax=Yoonia sp. I 8.24 TaxID=1537229 RepID=UPI001EDD9CD3|nr:5-oxoprolinase subunit PxpA [Yoonia sp. I 8.24]MCG3269315.1 LamB/YcsF family protein [Yoonia sp. I 8.24]